MSSLSEIPRPPAPKSAFVTTLGWTGVIGGAFGIALGALQWRLARPFAEQGFIDIVAQLHRYGRMSIAGSVPLVAVSWGLLKRREWARKGMLLLVGLTVLSHAALVPTLHKAFAAAGELPPDSLPALIVGAAKWTSYGGLAAATAALIWLGRKLAIPPVKDEFY